MKGDIIMEFRKPLIERTAEVLDINIDDIIEIDNNTFVVNTPTGVYDVKPVVSSNTVVVFDVTIDYVTYHLSIKQAKIVLHAESRVTLTEFAKEFGVEFDQETAKGIWVIPDAVFCNLDNYSDSISNYLNTISSAAAHAKDINMKIRSIDKFIDSSISRDGTLFCDNLENVAKMATFIADNEEFLANIKDILSFIDADLFSNMIKKYMEKCDISAEKIIHTINKLNDFKLSVIFSAFSQGIGDDGWPMNIGIEDHVTGFGLVISDRDTSYFDMVQMMFYDSDCSNNIIRGIRVPLGLFVDRMREHNPSQQINTTEFVIRKMAWTLLPHQYYPVGVDWFELFDYGNDKYDRYLTDSIYVFREDVTVDELSEEVEKSCPASDELQHLLAIIKEDCHYYEKKEDEE